MTSYLINHSIVEQLRSDLGTAARDAIEMGLTAYSDQIRDLMSRLTTQVAQPTVPELNDGWSATITYKRNGQVHNVDVQLCAAAVVREALGIDHHATGCDWEYSVSQEFPDADDCTDWLIPLTSGVLAEMVLNGRYWSKTVNLLDVEYTVEVDYSEH